MSLPTDQWSPALLRALAEYAPSRAAEAAARFPFTPLMPESTLVMMAQWIHDGCEVVRVSSEAGLELSRFGPLLHEAIHLPSRVIGVQMEGTDAVSFLFPAGDGERLGFLPWTRDRDGTWRSIAEGVQLLSMLDLAMGVHPLITHSPQSLRLMINGLVVARTQELIPAAPQRPSRPTGRRSAPSALPPVRRLLLDVSALYTWRRARAERQAQTVAASHGPSAPRGIHHVAQHMRRVRVRVEGEAELRVEWRPVAAHARGSERLLVRRDRVTTGVGDLRVG